MLSNISDLFTMASLVICMLLSGIIFYYLRTRINMLEQSVMDQAQLLQQVVTSIKSSQFRQMGSQQQQQQQHQQNNEDVERCPASLENNDYSLNNNSAIKLIQVSDDDSDNDSDNDSNNDSDDDSYDNDDDNNDNNELYYGGGNSGSKIIDLSTITSSSSMSFLPLTKSDDIKIIELKSNINLNDESDDVDQSDESDDSDDSDESENDNDEDNEDDNDEERDATVNENENENETTKNRNNVNNNRIFKSIVIEEDVTNELSLEESNILSLDKMKNMPVNTLRNLAKKKLNNVDTPTINKMSKKEILKAFNS